MTRQQIEPLVQFLQPTEADGLFYDPWQAAAPSTLINAQNIGLLAARTIVHTGVPAELTGTEYRFVVQAASLLAGKRPTTKLGISVDRALALHADDSSASLIEALLLAGDSDSATVAEIVGEDPEVIAAYESLAFNVRDRWEELTYIRRVIGQSRNEQILRTGFNGMLVDVLQYAGLGGYASDETIDSGNMLSQRVRRNALASAASWAASGSTGRIPALAACGLAIVQRQAENQPPVPEQQPGSTLADSIRAEMLRVRQAMDVAVNARIEEAARPSLTPAK